MEETFSLAGGEMKSERKAGEINTYEALRVLTKRERRSDWTMHVYRECIRIDQANIRRHILRGLGQHP
jgi:hypothetical protein